jgi:Flp pilus assembly protein TadG
MRHTPTTPRQRPGGERGAALMEMALTLPLLLLVTIGAVEFGRAYQTWQVLTNAAREGARVAVLPGVTDAVVKTRVTSYMTAGQLKVPATATIDVTRNNPLAIGSAGATASRVVINYPFTFMMLQPVAQLIVGGKPVGAPLTMSASALMRNE